MTLKIRILKCSRRLFIILISLTVTFFSEKMLISTRWIRGFMFNLIKKSLKDSTINSNRKVLWLNKLWVKRKLWKPHNHRHLNLVFTLEELHRLVVLHISNLWWNSRLDKKMQLPPEQVKRKCRLFQGGWRTSQTRFLSTRCYPVNIVWALFNLICQVVG